MLYASATTQVAVDIKSVPTLDISSKNSNQQINLGVMAQNVFGEVTLTFDYLKQKISASFDSK